MQDDPAHWMELALEEALAASERGEVPVGALIVREGQIIARAHNLTRERSDPTAHAEVLAIRAAAAALGDWRLNDCDLYVTLEPCAMCAGAMVLARIRRLVFAAADPKAGMCGSLGNIVEDERLNHRVIVQSGVGEAEAARLLRGFFGKRR
ncbi:MAG: tRNA adenosine(34) deaminase TadA [Candidatus Palauibacterales bacterium]|nr:tRNA adenosine(34) deaminase TadA [Candidatus Palauibacterales bacterium]